MAGINVKCEILNIKERNMRKLFMIALAMAIPMLGMAKKEKVTNVRWCTYNMRCINKGDTEKGVGWDSRKDRACQWVLDNDIDVVGMQEVTHQQLLDILFPAPGDGDHLPVLHVQFSASQRPLYFGNQAFISAGASVPGVSWIWISSPSMVMVSLVAIS